MDWIKETLNIIWNIIGSFITLNKHNKKKYLMNFFEDFFFDNYRYKYN